MSHHSHAPMWAIGFSYGRIRHVHGRLGPVSDNEQYVKPWPWQMLAGTGGCCDAVPGWQGQAGRGAYGQPGAGMGHPCPLSFLIGEPKGARLSL